MNHILVAADIIDSLGEGDAGPDARFNYHFEEP